MLGKFLEGDIIESACPNAACEDHMIAKRFPTTLEYIVNQNVVMVVPIISLCPVCKSPFPPKGE